MKEMVLRVIIILTLFFYSSCNLSGKHEEGQVLFRFGYKTASTSTGPLRCSGFTFRLDGSSPLLFITAHHVVSADGNGRYYKWNELEEKVKNGWLWSQQDSSINLMLGKNIPIQGARSSHLDMAAFHVEQTDATGYLDPAAKEVHVGDTIQLFTKLLYDTANVGLHHFAKVIYTGDSAIVYEFFSGPPLALDGTSGSPVLNKDKQVVALSFGSLTFPNSGIRKQCEKELPFIHDLVLTDGKTYAIGLPIEIIKSSLRRVMNPEVKHS